MGIAAVGALAQLGRRRWRRDRVGHVVGEVEARASGACHVSPGVPKHNLTTAKKKPAGAENFQDVGRSLPWQGLHFCSLFDETAQTVILKIVTWSG